MIDDLFDTLALDAPVRDQLGRQCFDGCPMRHQQRQCALGERLRVEADTCQPPQVTSDVGGALQVHLHAAVGLRERQYLLLAPLAAMDRLGDATGKLDNDLRLHQGAVAWRDAVDGPFRRINSDAKQFPPHCPDP